MFGNNFALLYPFEPLPLVTRGRYVHKGGEERAERERPERRIDREESRTGRERERERETDTTRGHETRERLGGTERGGETGACEN